MGRVWANSGEFSGPSAKKQFPRKLRRTQQNKKTHTITKNRELAQIASFAKHVGPIRTFCWPPFAKRVWAENATLGHRGEKRFGNVWNRPVASQKVDECRGLPGHVRECAGAPGMSRHGCGNLKKKSENAQECPGTFGNVDEGQRKFRGNIEEGLKIFGNGWECPDMSKNLREDSDEALEKSRRMPGNAQERHRTPENGENRPGVSGASRNSSTFSCIPPGFSVAFRDITGPPRKNPGISRRPPMNSRGHFSTFLYVSRKSRSHPDVFGRPWRFTDVSPHSSTFPQKYCGPSSTSPETPGHFSTFFDLPSEFSRAFCDIPGRSRAFPDFCTIKGN